MQSLSPGLKPGAIIIPPLKGRCTAPPRGWGEVGWGLEFIVLPGIALGQVHRVLRGIPGHLVHDDLPDIEALAAGQEEGVDEDVGKVVDIGHVIKSSRFNIISPKLKLS